MAAGNGKRCARSKGAPSLAIADLAGGRNLRHVAAMAGAWRERAAVAV
jgi:hypothetical protein